MRIVRDVGEKGQVVIPKDIREMLGIDKSKRVVFEVEKNKITLESENDPIAIVEDFFNTPKIEKKLSTKDLKKIYEEQYG